MRFVPHHPQHLVCFLLAVGRSGFGYEDGASFLAGDPEFIGRGLRFGATAALS
jgi:hypothetical protein